MVSTRLRTRLETASSRGGNMADGKKEDSKEKEEAKEVAEPKEAQEEEVKGDDEKVDNIAVRETSEEEDPEEDCDEKNSKVGNYLKGFIKRVIICTMFCYLAKLVYPEFQTRFWPDPPVKVFYHMNGPWGIIDQKLRKKQAIT